MKTENLLKIISLNERVEEEAATIPDILHFFDRGNFISVREITCSHGSLKRDVCGNHVLTSTILVR